MTTEPTPAATGSPTLAGIPNMDAPFDATAAAQADRAYDSLTDAEIINDEAAFTRAYTFAAHRAARHLHGSLAEIERLRQRVHEAVDETQRRYAPMQREFQKLRNLMHEAKDWHAKEMAAKGKPVWSELSGYGQAAAAGILAERDAAIEARDRLREYVLTLADDIAEPGEPTFRGRIADRLRLAATAPPAAPSGPQDAETVSDIPQWERDFLDRQEAAERAGAPDQGMVRDAGGRANEELYEALAGAMSALDWAANHISLAYELHLKSVPARTAGDEHLQALRRIAAAHQAPDASPAELAGLVEGTAATLDRITAERDKARRERDSFARRLSVRYQELAEARQAHANQRAAHEQARDDAVAAEAQLAEARQEAERLRGEVDKIADEIEGTILDDYSYHAQYSAVADQLRAALASTGGNASPEVH